MGKLYEAIKDYMKDYDKCNECIEPTFDFYGECIEPTFDFQLEELNEILL